MVSKIEFECEDFAKFFFFNKDKRHSGLLLLRENNSKNTIGDC